MVDISGRQEMAATGPAWQVRESARQRLLEGIQGKILLHETGFAESDIFNLYWTLSYLFFHQIRRLEGHMFNDLSKSRWANERKASRLFSKVLEEIEKFKRTQEEERALLAKLLEWTASELARPYHMTLQRQEILDPKNIYGTEHADDEVPFE